MHPRRTELRPPRSLSDWDRLHAIRQDEIFARYHPPDTPWWVPYDPDHPDDRAPGKQPLVQLLDGAVVGTCRVDALPGGRAAIRLVAVDPEFRGLGLGDALMEAAEDWAARTGAGVACLNAQPGVAGFYRRRGWEAARWTGHSRCPRAIPMCKGLRELAFA